MKLTRFARRSAVVLLLAAASAPVGALRAEPAASLPAGFVAASPTLGKPTVRKTGVSSLQSNHETTFAARSPLPGAVADIAMLPVVEVEPSDRAPAAPSTTMPAGDAGDLVVLKLGPAPRLSVQGFEVGTLRVGNAQPVATGRQSAGGIARACGPRAGGAGVTPLSYEAIRRYDTRGNLELVMGRGFLDTASCQVVTTRRLVARPTHLGGGIVYAFKTRCASCAAGAREELHVIVPQGQSRKFDFFVPFEHHRLPLERGISAAFSGATGTISSSFNDWSLPDWDGLVKRQCKVDRFFCFTDVRLEVSWALGEPSPTAYLAGDFLAAAPAAPAPPR